MILTRVQNGSGVQRSRAYREGLLSLQARGYVAVDTDRTLAGGEVRSFKRCYPSASSTVYIAPGLDPLTLDFELHIVLQVFGRYPVDGPTGGRHRTVEELRAFLAPKPDGKRLTRQAVQAALWRLYERGLVTYRHDAKGNQCREWEPRTDVVVVSPQRVDLPVSGRTPMRLVPKAQRAAEVLRIRGKVDPGSYWAAELGLSRTEDRTQRPPTTAPPKETPMKADDMIARAQTGAVRPEAATGDQKTRREVHEAYKDWEERRYPFQGVPEEQAAKVLLGRYCVLAGHLADRHHPPTKKHLAATLATYRWFRDLKEDPIEFGADTAIIAAMRGDPAGTMLKAMLALFSQAFCWETFDYSPTTVFKPGFDQGFVKFCFTSMWKLEAGHFERRFKPPKLAGRSFAEVEAQLATTAARQANVPVPTSNRVQAAIDEAKRRAAASKVGSVL